jgi:hypothetical protein
MSLGITLCNFRTLKMPDLAPGYAYESLPHGKWFRLLHLYPGQLHEPLSCSLFIQELSSSPPFKALSYVWGDANDTLTITCSGYSKSITRNLYLALRRTRSTRQVVTLWADSICIDQSNGTEKGRQIDLFGTIYNQAEDVIVWLGEDSDNSGPAAFDTITSINSLISDTADKIRPAGKPDTLASLRRLNTEALTLIKDKVRTILDTRRKRCIEALYRLPYFTRVWVLQEVGLARNPVAIWGKERIDFAHIALFVYYCTSLQDLQLQLGDDIARVILHLPWRALRNIWCTYGEGSWTYNSPALRQLSQWVAQYTPDLLLILDASRQFLATVPLDHVYALLGHPSALVPGGNGPLLFADYSLDVKTLSYNLISRLATQSLNFLTHVRSLDQEVQPRLFPSWLPRWDTNWDLGPSSFWEFWDASLRKSERKEFKYLITREQLQVSGVILDSVSGQTKVMIEEQLVQSEGFIETLKECWSLSTAATIERQSVDDETLLAIVASLSCYFNQFPLLEYVMALEDIYLECGLLSSKRIYDDPTEASRTIPSSELRSILRRQIQIYSANRRYLTTKKGYCGIGPPNMRTGDLCVVLSGADVPFIIRPSDGNSHYTLVGECYIYGFMYGEAILYPEKTVSSTAELDIIIV